MTRKIKSGARAALGRPLLTAMAIFSMTGFAGSVQAQDHVTLGAGVAVVPTYDGSDEMRTLPMPIIDIKEGRFFANMTDGAGIYAVDTPNLKIGGSVVFIMGYRQRDLPAGIDKLENTAGGRLFATASTGGLSFTLGATRSIGGTEGVTVDGRLSYLIRATDRLTIVPSAALVWSDKSQNRDYFGIDQAEATVSGLPEFAPSSGLSSVSLGLTANYRLGSRLNVVGGATASRLTGDVQDSPLIERKTVPRFLFGLSYAL